MSASFWNFDFQKRKQLRFSEDKLSKLQQKRPNFAILATSFSPKIRGKQEQVMDPFHTP